MEVGAVKQAFNNEIILMKRNLNQAKIQIIHKLTRKAKTLAEKKAPENLKEKLKKKAESAVKEVLIIKKIKAKDIAKFIVTYNGELTKYLNKPEVDHNKACARLLLHKSMHEKHKYIRETFGNTSINDLFMSRLERRKMKKEAREKQKNKKKEKEAKKLVNVEGDWNVEEIGNKTKIIGKDQDREDDREESDNEQDSDDKSNKDNEQDSDDKSNKDNEQDSDDKSNKDNEQDSDDKSNKDNEQDSDDKSNKDNEQDSDDKSNKDNEQDSDDNLDDDGQDSDDEPVSDKEVRNGSDSDEALPSDSEQSDNDNTEVADSDKSDTEIDDRKIKQVKRKEDLQKKEIKDNVIESVVSMNVNNLNKDTLNNSKSIEIPKNLPKEANKKKKDVNKNKNFNEKILKRKFNKVIDEKPMEEIKMADPFFITTTGESYMSVVEPRQPDEVKEIHKQGNRKYRRAVMFGYVPKPRKEFKHDNRKFKDLSNTDNYRRDSFKNKLNNDDKQENEKVEKLHPSWEAKKRKSGILPFEGKKIVFDDE